MKYPRLAFHPVVTSPCFKVKESVEEENSQYIYVSQNSVDSKVEHQAMQTDMYN